MVGGRMPICDMWGTPRIVRDGVRQENGLAECGDMQREGLGVRGVIQRIPCCLRHNVEVWRKEQGVVPLNGFTGPVVPLGFRMKCVECGCNSFPDLFTRNGLCFVKLMHEQLVKYRGCCRKVFNQKEFVTHHCFLEFRPSCLFVVIYPSHLSSRMTEGQNMLKNLSMF